MFLPRRGAALDLRDDVVGKLLVILFGACLSAHGPPPVRCVVLLGCGRPFQEPHGFVVPEAGIEPLTPVRRHIERGPPCPIPHPRIGPGLEQPFGNVRGAIGSGIVQGSPPLRIGNTRVGVGVEQVIHGFRRIRLDGQVQRSLFILAGREVGIRPGLEQPFNRVGSVQGFGRPMQWGPRLPIPHVRIRSLLKQTMNAER